MVAHTGLLIVAERGGEAPHAPTRIGPRSLPGDDWLSAVYNWPFTPKVHAVCNPARLGWKPIAKVEHYSVDSSVIIASEEKTP